MKRDAVKGSRLIFDAGAVIWLSSAQDRCHLISEPV